MRELLEAIRAVRAKTIEQLESDRWTVGHRLELEAWATELAAWELKVLHKINAWE